MEKTFSLTVSELTHTIRFILEDTFDSIRVVGEISNYKQHASGHRYFTLKDDGAQISCTMWRGRTLNFIPMDGMKVSVFGNLTVYPPQGKYQIDCVTMTPLGQGDLYLAFEALKKKLHAEGYFDELRKRPIPALPLKIGVITSPTGAAKRDILSTLKRRMPAAEIIFRPALVQGDGAAEDLALALEEINQTECDVVIIGRGGGSIEDLWAFNTEIVAEAIFSSQIPVVSAVGHEVDFTIADYVADLRAATPTAAAELVTPRSADDLIAHFVTMEEFFRRKISERLEEYFSYLEMLEESPGFRRFGEKIFLIEQELDESALRMENSIKKILSNAKKEISSLEAHCSSLHPLSPLKKGFALLISEGKILPKENSLSGLENIEIIRESESAEAKILSVKKENFFQIGK